MPIHQTKLTMAKPQATGIMMPNRPTPTAINAAMQKNRTSTSAKETAKPIYQNRGVRPVKTIELILSVIDPKVCSPPMSGNELSASVDWFCGFGSMRLAVVDLRIGIFQLGPVRGPRLGVQLGQQAVVQRQRFQFDHPTLRIVAIAKDDCLGRTSLLAGGHDLAVAHLAIFFFRADLRLINALDTVGAFFHHAAGTHGDIGIVQ